MTQRVLVTAGAGGIGLATARAFEAGGAMVHVADVDAKAVNELVQASPRISGSVLDIADAAAVARLVEDVRQKLGGLDVLVNNAGVAGPTAAVADYPDEAWASVIGVNLNGTFNVTKAFIPMLEASRQASIVIMSSVAGRFGYPNRCAYATSKWGLVGFAKTLSMELGPLGITCNTIHPGAVEGPRIQRVLQGRAEASGRSLEQEVELALANQSIKAFVDPRDIAELVRFLAGPHARSISGQSFPIDGDSKSTQ